MNIKLLHFDGLKMKNPGLNHRVCLCLKLGRCVLGNGLLQALAALGHFHK